MSNTALLKSSATVVVKSTETLPAASTKRGYADFDAFVANADHRLDHDDRGVGPKATRIAA